MTATDEIIADYRARLRRASADLPPDVRDELLDDLEAHLSEVRATSGSAEATRAALARLGDPVEVAAAARRELGAPPPPTGDPSSPVGRPRVRGLDVAAVVLLLIGALVLPVLGWFVGVVLLWASATWSRGEKLLGTFVIPGGLATPFALTLFGGQTCSSTAVIDSLGNSTTSSEVCEGFAFAPIIGVPLMITLLIAPAVVAGVLLRRARDRAAPVPIGPRG